MAVGRGGALRLLIVDSQVHIWAHGQPSAHHRQTALGAQELLAEMAGAGVDRAVLVPPAWDPDGNALSLAATHDHPERFRVMGLLRPDDPAARGDLASWRDNPAFVGVRLSFNSPETRSVLISGAADWIWGAAVDLDYPVMVLAPGLLPLLADVARRHPGLRLIVDHLAIPRGATGPAAFAHVPELQAIARLPNVAVKAVGLPAYAQDEGFPYTGVHEPLRRIIDAFGPERVFWGTDLSRMRVSYRNCVDMFTQRLPWLAGDDLAAIMGESLMRWLRWDGRQD